MIYVIRRVWRYQIGNQNPHIEEVQTIQWPKEKIQKSKQRSTKHTHKTKDRVTWTPLKTGGELTCSGRVSSSCSTSGTRPVKPGDKSWMRKGPGSGYKQKTYKMYMYNWVIKGVSVLPLSTIFLLDLGTVPTVWWVLFLHVFLVIILDYILINISVIAWCFF